MFGWLGSGAVGTIAGLAITALTCTAPTMAQTQVPNTASVLGLAQGVFKPLPASMATRRYPITSQLVELGDDLYWDPRLSADGAVSCARCHQPAGAYAEGR